MTSLASTLEAFFKIRLAQQRRASPHTVTAYRDTFRLLFHFVHDRTGKTPSELEMEDLDAATVGDFLTYLEEVRGNSVRTRNARLAAIHSFFRFASFNSGTPRTHSKSSAYGPFLASGSIGGSSPSSRSRKRRHSSPPRPAKRGVAVATKPCCLSPCRPVSGSQRSPA